MAKHEHDTLLKRAQDLGLHGLCARWDELGAEAWISTLLSVSVQPSAS
jgi:hypothetical protein